MEEGRAQADAVQDALAAAREEVARLETLRADQGRLLVEELKRDLRDCFIEPVREGIPALKSCCGCKHFLLETLLPQFLSPAGDLESKSAREGESGDLSFQVLKLVIDAAFRHGGLLRLTDRACLATPDPKSPGEPASTEANEARERVLAGEEAGEVAG